tara:strand:- start:922 stop:1263 length:342 start_codon:yes stop_codon:yes gene_type:complete
MQKWEIMAWPMNPTEIQMSEGGAEAIIEMGMNGWELVTVIKENNGHIGYFKRPISEQTKQEYNAPNNQKPELDVLVNDLNQWSIDFENFRKTLPPKTDEDEALELFKNSLQLK